MDLLPVYDIAGEVSYVDVVIISIINFFSKLLIALFLLYYSLYIVRIVGTT